MSWIVSDAEMNERRKGKIMDNSIIRKTIRLAMLVVVSYCLVGFVGSITTVSHTIHIGSAAEPTILDGYHILVLITVPFYFLPLAVKISKLAKEAGMKILRGISIFVITTFVLFVFVNIIIIIVYFINPGLFT